MRVMLSGEIGFHDWEILSAYFRNYLSAGILRWHIDLTALHFIDSAVLGMLISMLATLRGRDGDMQLRVLANSQLASMLKIAKLERLMTIQYKSATVVDPNQITQ
jgi:anti-anti-sigma factor